MPTTEREQLGDIARRCEAAVKAIDGVVNAAGVNLRQPVDEITLEAGSHARLGLAVPFFFTREFGRKCVNGDTDR